MIEIDKEYYSSPYYFFIRNKGDKYSIYFSVDENLVEARKKDEVLHFEKNKVGRVKKYIDKVSKDKKVKNTKTIKKDLEELVNSDGSMTNSKIPILDPRLHPRKTMDQTVAMASITNDPIARGYRTYYGESVDEEIKEIDYSNVFGWEETKDMDGPSTYKYMVKKLGVEPDEAVERTKEQGKNPFKKKKKITITEIQKQKMIKMVEDMLTKKKQDDADVTKKPSSTEDIPFLIQKNIKSLLRQCDKHNITKTELIKLIKSE